MGNEIPSGIPLSKELKRTIRQLKQSRFPIILLDNNCSWVFANWMAQKLIGLKSEKHCFTHTIKSVCPKYQPNMKNISTRDYFLMWYKSSLKSNTSQTQMKLYYDFSSKFHGWVELVLQIIEIRSNKFGKITIKQLNKNPTGRSSPNILKKRRFTTNELGSNVAFKNIQKLLRKKKSRKIRKKIKKKEKEKEKGEGKEKEKEKEKINLDSEIKKEDDEKENKKEKEQEKEQEKEEEIEIGKSEEDDVKEDEQEKTVDESDDTDGNYEIIKNQKKKMQKKRGLSYKKISTKSSFVYDDFGLRNQLKYAIESKPKKTLIHKNKINKNINKEQNHSDSEIEDRNSIRKKNKRTFSDPREMFLAIEILLRKRAVEFSTESIQTVESNSQEILQNIENLLNLVNESPKIKEQMKLQICEKLLSILEFHKNTLKEKKLETQNLSQCLLKERKNHQKKIHLLNKSLHHSIEMNDLEKRKKKLSLDTNHKFKKQLNKIKEQLKIINSLTQNNLEIENSHLIFFNQVKAQLI